MELGSSAQRTSYGACLFVVPWSLGFMFTPIVGYFLREWRFLQAAYSTPTLVLLLYCWWEAGGRWTLIGQCLKKSTIAFLCYLRL